MSKQNPLSVLARDALGTFRSILSSNGSSGSKKGLPQLRSLYAKAVQCELSIAPAAPQRKRSRTLSQDKTRPDLPTASEGISSGSGSGSVDVQAAAERVAASSVQRGLGLKRSSSGSTAVKKRRRTHSEDRQGRGRAKSAGKKEEDDANWTPEDGHDKKGGPSAADEHLRSQNPRSAKKSSPRNDAPNNDGPNDGGDGSFGIGDSIEVTINGTVMCGVITGKEGRKVDLELDNGEDMLGVDIAT